MRKDEYRDRSIECLRLASETTDPTEKARLLDMYERMVQIRTFEDSAGTYFAAGKIPGFVHLYAGDEAVSAIRQEIIRIGNGISALLRRAWQAPGSCSW